MVADRDWHAVRGDAARTLLCAVVLGLASCGTAMHGSLTTSGYLSDYGYQIAYRSGTGQMLPPKWNVDNFTPGQGKWVPKDRDEYITKYEFDVDGDGDVDIRIDRPTYALRYEHRVHSGVIWLRNIPLSPKLRSKDLRVLLQDYIDQITGVTTYETVKFRTNRVQVVEDHPVAAIIEQGSATVAGQPAYMATIETANADQIKLDPGTRRRRVQFVIMRAPQDDPIDPDKGTSDKGTSDKGTSSLRATTLPVVILAGYSNMPADFQAGLEDFHDFLRRLTIGDRSGLLLDAAPAEPPPAAAPPATAPPATATTPAPSR